VAIVSEDALVRLKQGDRSSKFNDAQAKVSPQSDQGKQETPKPKPPPPAAAPPPPPPPAAEPEPPKPEPVKAEPPPPPPAPAKDPIAEQLAMLEPAPGPSPEEIKRIEDQKRADDQKKAEELKRQEDARKAAEAKKKADAEKKRLADLKKKQDDEKKRKDAEAKKLADAKAQSFEDKIEAALSKSALADKDPTRKAPPPANAVDQPTPSKNKGPVAGAAEGRDTQNTANQRAMIVGALTRAVGRCFRVDAGAGATDGYIPVVDFELNRDGNLRGEPRLVNQPSSPLSLMVGDNAVRAIKQCAPYSLPPEFYSDWEAARLRFDPKIFQ
jgi:colicin import membrane protein